ncbi:GNAT family N-acetyltransferase [Lentibacillus cibarius]|nr:GNAT family N-acetyltransferase [Lentibacillus cibarius]
MLNSPETYTASYCEIKRNSVYVYKVRLQSVNAFTFGAFVEDELVGVVTLVRGKKKKTDHRATLRFLYVTPFEREKGIGKQLMQTAINHAKSLDGVEQICLSIVVNDKNKKMAERFCYALGFVPFGVHKGAVKAGDHYYDEEHMVMFLH